MEKRKRGNKSFLARQYSDSWNYIKSSRDFIFIIIGIFFFFGLAGYFIPVPEAVAERILEFIEEILNKTEGMSNLELIRFIFLNNVQSSFVGMVFGVFVGLFSVMASAANGYLLGFVASMSVGEGGIFVLWRLFPHGIFELPAIFISLGLGLKLGTFIFQKKRLENFKRYFLDSLRVFLSVVIPLLIIAAIIEGTLIFLV